MGLIVRCNRKLIRVITATAIASVCWLFSPGCGNLTPQQVQTVAATTAATVAIVGTTAQAFPNKHISPQQVQAITTAAVQTAQVVGQAAASWTPAPTTTPATPH